ncbi:MAG: zinc-ribbon domain-containing protein, partial [Solirubrobacteraceae bacterium]
MPVPSGQSETTCEHCGAPLLADQRYCLACGQPCSPVRLAFLDVLQGEQSRGALPGPGGWAPGTIDMSPVGYGPAYPQQGAA